MPNVYDPERNHSFSFGYFSYSAANFVSSVVFDSIFLLTSYPVSDLNFRVFISDSVSNSHSLNNYLFDNDDRISRTVTDFIKAAKHFFFVADHNHFCSYVSPF